MILSKRLRNEKKISHGFFNKNGGSSNGIYRSLNCGPGSNDKKNKIKKNLRIVKNKFGRKTKNIFLVHQIHSNKFIYIDEKNKNYKKKIKVDAIKTNLKKLTIAVLNADCDPQLLYERKYNCSSSCGLERSF